MTRPRLVDDEADRTAPHERRANTTLPLRHGGGCQEGRADGPSAAELRKESGRAQRKLEGCVRRSSGARVEPAS